MTEAGYSGSLCDFWNSNGPQGCSRRMFPDYSPPALARCAPPGNAATARSRSTRRPSTKRTGSSSAKPAEARVWSAGFYRRIAEPTSSWSSPRFSGSVMAFRQEFLTHSTSESPSDAVASSLSDILEPRVDPKYYLSPKAAAGILRRAEKRERSLPENLRAALELLAAGTTTGPTREPSSDRSPSPPQSPPPPGTTDTPARAETPARTSSPTSPTRSPQARTPEAPEETAATTSSRKKRPRSGRPTSR